MVIAIQDKRMEKVLNPLQVIAVFDEISRVWNEKYLDKYAYALAEQSIYFPEDANAEAYYVGTMMQKDYLKSFLINQNDGFSDFESVMSAINDYRKEIENPAIFILGSGNISIPLIMNIIIGILTNQHIYYRASAGNAAAIRVWLESLTDPELLADLRIRDQDLDCVMLCIRQEIEEISLSHEDEAYKNKLKTLPVQKAYLWGGAEAIENTIQMLDSSVEIFSFGPRTGVLLVETDWWSNLAQLDKIEIANAIYKNILSNDAAMCSSPTIGIIIGSEQEAETTLNEIMQLIQHQDTEKLRLSRPILLDASKHRISMQQWVKFGFKLYSPQGSITKFALGDLLAHQRKNQFFTTPGEYHASAGSLEIIRFNANELQDAASLISHLQLEIRYKGLWSVGHLITVMNPKSIIQLLEFLKMFQESDFSLRKDPNVMKVEAIRIVDVRENIGRKPGDRLDGIALGSSLLK